jgi:hypothetical protein
MYWCYFCFCSFNQHDLISLTVSVSTRQSVWSSCYSLVWLDIRPCLTATQCYRWSDNCNDDFARSFVCGQYEYLDAPGTGDVASCRGHGQIGRYAPASRSCSSCLCLGILWMGQYAVCFGGKRYCYWGGNVHKQFLGISTVSDILGLALQYTIDFIRGYDRGKTDQKKEGRLTN